MKFKCNLLITKEIVDRSEGYFAERRTGNERCPIRIILEDKFPGCEIKVHHLNLTIDNVSYTFSPKRWRPRVFDLLQAGVIRTAVVPIWRSNARQLQYLK